MRGMTSNTDNPTRLDVVYQRMQSSPESETAGLRFYEAFCDANLCVLINADTSMQVFETSQGKIVLAFDTDERVAEFISEATEFIKIAGRDLVMQLLASETGIGLNLNVAPTSQILSPDILTWLSEFLAESSSFSIDQVVAISPPDQWLDDHKTAISTQLEKYAGMIASAYFCSVTYSDNTVADAVFIVDCDPTTEAVLFTALVESQKFLDKNTAEIAIKFISPDNQEFPEICRVGEEIVISKLTVIHTSAPTAPGMDPDKPPKLR